MAIRLKASARYVGFVLVVLAATAWFLLPSVLRGVPAFARKSLPALYGEAVAEQIATLPGKVWLVAIPDDEGKSLSGPEQATVAKHAKAQLIQGKDVSCFPGCGAAFLLQLIDSAAAMKTDLAAVGFLGPLRVGATESVVDFILHVQRSPARALRPSNEGSVARRNPEYYLQRRDFTVIFGQEDGRWRIIETVVHRSPHAE